MLNQLPEVRPGIRRTSCSASPHADRLRRPETDASSWSGGRCLPAGRAHIRFPGRVWLLDRQDVAFPLQRAFAVAVFGAVYDIMAEARSARLVLPRAWRTSTI